MRVATPGFYDIPEADYHADPCADPSISSSLISTIVDRTLADAWWQHPRFNPELQPDDDTAFDLGSTAHTLVLGKGAEIVPLPYDDWRKGDAKADRAAALAAGKQPCLQRVFDQASEMREALVAQLKDSENASAFTDAGFAEQTAIWQHESEHGLIWCRAKMDWRDRFLPQIYDYKTFKPGADPAGFGKYLFREHRAVQDPFYSMGVGALLKLNWISEVQYRFVVQSPDPPYVASVIQLDDEARELAWRQTTWALDQWGGAVKAGRFRGYRPRTYFVGAPTWEINDWDARMEAEKFAAALDARAAA